MTDPKRQDLEVSFRSSLVDCVTILERLAPMTGTVEELVASLRLAADNDTQLRFLMALVYQQGKK